MTLHRVLVIDDNAVTRSLIASALESEDVALVEASTGAEGIERAKSSPPDVILLDIGLPDMSGFVVAEQLREATTKHVPLLALAGLLDEGDERLLADAKFEEVVAKPIDPPRLREAVRAQLQSVPVEQRVIGTRRRLLLVDDDPLQRKLTAMRLSRFGFDVAISECATDALAAIEETLPDIVVSDVLMPQIDGFELCARLRADPRNARVRVILLTNSYLDRSDHELARRVGADAYVHREPDLRGLLAALEHTFVHSTDARVRISAPELRRERNARTARQLDKQLALNVSLAQKISILSAEIAILEGLARALADSRDPDSAIEAALLACFDAGRFAWGVVVTQESNGETKQRSVGPSDAALRESLAAIAIRIATSNDSKSTQHRTLADLVEIQQDGHVLIAPMRYHDRTIGALALGATTAPTDDQRAFATVVSSQIALVLSLSGAFVQLQQATQKERERAHVLETILDTIAEPIVVVDRDARPVHWNRAARPAPTTRSDRSTSAWPTTQQLFHADMSTPVSDRDLPVHRALAGEEVDACEVFASRGANDAAWLSIAARPVRDDDEEITGAVVMTRDVTVAKRAHAQQITSDRLASVGVLAAGVAHEINNPLTSMINELEMALEDIDDAHPSRDRLRVAYDAAKRVRTISNDLKTLSRGDGDGNELIDVGRVLEVAVRMAAPEWRKCAQIQLEIPELPLVFGNEARLVQVFLNLIVNAAQAIGPHPDEEHHIAVRASLSADRTVVVEVSDTGCGMSPEVKARLFTPFFTTKPVGAGTGLGLSISQRIVSDLGGRIECDSVAGKGTTFRVYLPTHAPVSSENEARSPQRSAAEIVLVEGDPLARQLVSKAIGRGVSLVILPHVAALLDRPAPARGSALVLCSSADAQIAGRDALDAVRARGYTVGMLGGSAHPWLQPLASLRRPFDARAVQQFVATLVDQMNSEGSDE